jgi:FeS assembly SUF system protein
MREKTIRFRGQEDDRVEQPDTPVDITGDTLGERVISALRGVYDPELPVNIYDLGLIYEINLDEPGKVGISMTLTSPACPVAGTLPGMVEKAVSRLDEIDEVSVSLVWDPPWSQDRMTDEARLEMGLF